MHRGKLIFLTMIASTFLFFQVVPGSVDNANAQVPYVQVSFDDYGAVYAKDCPLVVTEDTLSVFAFNFDMFMSKIQYKILFGPALSFCGDVFDERVSVVGNSEWGIEITFLDIADAHAPFRVQQICVIWFCTDCAEYLDTQIVVRPHPNSGQLSAVRWPDLAVIDAVGMTSVTCPGTLPAEATTWGQVKSLYH